MNIGNVKGTYMIMLLQFNFKNFKSFRDDTTINFTAAKIQDFSDHVVQIGNEKVFPVAAFFGANAGGKSNVIEAFDYMSEYVACSLSYGEEIQDTTSLHHSFLTVPQLMQFIKWLIQKKLLQFRFKTNLQAH